MSRGNDWRAIAWDVLEVALSAILTGAFLLAVWVGLGGCCRPGERYRRYYSDVTSYPVDWCSARKTPAGIRVLGSTDVQIWAEIDKRTTELEACLKVPIKREAFGVLIPHDWYVSACSGEQLVPSVMPCQLCRAKGLQIPDQCCGLRKPTQACPCVCNARATIQGNYWIVSAPNLKLFKAELARLVLGVNNPWKAHSACLR